MQKIKNEITKVLKNYRINKSYLRYLIKKYYKEGSRMDYYATHEKYLYQIDHEIKKILWEKHGIPHLIFDDILFYMSDEVEEEGFIDERKSRGE